METQETLTTPFVGDGCADDAQAWVHSKSFVWRDFPKSKGWTHFAWWNDSAGKELAKKRVEDLLEHGEMVESYIP